MKNNPEGTLTMKPIHQIAILTAVGLLISITLILLVRGTTVAVMQPAGLIASEERTLMLNVIALMLIVALPILGLAFFFAWWYRAGNTRAMYLPDWEHGIMTELVWWAIPLEIVLVLGALTWTSTHELDPHKALTLQGETLKIQVVALDWKWLFIYPEQNIATVNFVEFPANRPVEFDITADAPMNSFWIPQLGGQIYAMTGMVTKLNLVADEAGVFAGGSANYSGEGFAHMKFQARAVPQQDFDTWVGNIRASSSTLDLATYDTLARPSDASMQEHFGSVASKLYDTILMKFMPAPPPSPIHDMGAMQM